MCVCARVCETRASCYILSLFHTHTLKHTSHLKCIFRVGLLWCCTSQPTRYLKKIFFPEYLHSWQSNQISSNSINALVTIAYKSKFNRTSRPRAKKCFRLESNNIPFDARLFNSILFLLNREFLTACKIFQPGKRRCGVGNEKVTKIEIQKWLSLSQIDERVVRVNVV